MSSSIALFHGLFYSDLVIWKLIRLEGIKNVKIKEFLIFLSSLRVVSTYAALLIGERNGEFLSQWQRDSHLPLGSGSHRALSRDAAEHLCAERSLHLNCSSIYLHLRSFPLKFSFFKHSKYHGIVCNFLLVFSVTPTFNSMFCSACSLHELRCELHFTRYRKYPQLRKMKTVCIFVTRFWEILEQ